MDNTGTPAGMQISAPPGSDGLMLSLGLAMERMFGPMPPPPTTAACSGCTANVSYVPVSHLRLSSFGRLAEPGRASPCQRQSISGVAIALRNILLDQYLQSA